jgi:hypothetical protein
VNGKVKGMFQTTNQYGFEQQTMVEFMAFTDDKWWIQI